jgi:hypothetical protein
MYDHELILEVLDIDWDNNSTYDEPLYNLKELKSEK